MENEAERWRPVYRAVVQNLTQEEAEEVIMFFMSLQQRSAMPPVRSPPTRAATPPRTPQKRSSEKRRDIAPKEAEGRRDPALKLVASSAEPLPAEDYFSIEEASRYLGLGPERLRQILSTDPERLPHKRKPGDRGAYLLLGRGLNKFRLAREQSAKRLPAASSDSGNGHGPSVEGQDASDQTIVGSY